MSSLREYTSFNSFQRGIAYFEEKRVKIVEQIDDIHYKCMVSGSNDNEYEVIVNTKKFRASTCTCPYCEGHKLRMCKHKIASIFAVCPNEYTQVINEYKDYVKERNRAQKEKDCRLNKLYQSAQKEVNEQLDKMSSQEIREELYRRMYQEYIEYKEHDIEEDYLDYDDDDEFY